MASFVKYEVFSENLAEKVHNLDTDTLKVMLSNSAPNVATHTVRADATEISGGNGYTSGGADSQNATSRSGGTTSVTGVDVTFTASGGTIGAFRYAILYNDTSISQQIHLLVIGTTVHQLHSQTANHLLSILVHQY